MILILGTYPLLGYKDGIALTGEDVMSDPDATKNVRIRSGDSPFMFFDGHNYYLENIDRLFPTTDNLTAQAAANRYAITALENYNRYGGSLPLSIRMYTKSLFHFSNLDGLSEPTAPLPTDRIKNAGSLCR